jgi:uncharacterized protein (TIGR02266 family)
MEIFMKKRHKILLADDIELFLEMEKNLLQRDDLDLIISRGGEKALEMIKQHSPQVAFLGLQMSDMSGVECCRKVKANETTSGTAVVLMLPAGQPEQAELCRQAGCDEVLFKPIKHDEFLATVRRFVPLDVRSGKRLKAQLRVSYGAEPQKVLADYSVDLSTGGLYLKTEQPLEVDVNLTLRFSLPDLQRLVTCKARVAWVNDKEAPRKPEFPPGMGVQFVDMSLEDVKSIRRFLEYNELEPSW